MNEAEPSPLPAADTWEGILAALRRRYPAQKDSVLFCIYKLQHNPDLSLRDFRAEAELYGIPMAGRALHSARLLLGLVKVEPAATDAVLSPLTAVDRGPRRQRERTAADNDGSIEDKVLTAVRQIQSAAGAESDKLRTAIKQAIVLLQRALGQMA